MRAEVRAGLELPKTCQEAWGWMEGQGEKGNFNRSSQIWAETGNPCWKAATPALASLAAGKVELAAETQSVLLLTPAAAQSQP